MVDPKQFREVMGYFATGITVVTTHCDGKYDGLTVNAFTSVSLDPLLVLVCLDKRLSSLDAFKKSKRFGISILSEDQEQISRTFATSGSERPDSLYLSGQTGVPILKDAIATFECETTQIYEGGDHLIFVGEVKALATGKVDRRPLLYHRGRYAQLR